MQSLNKHKTFFPLTACAKFTLARGHQRRPNTVKYILCIRLDSKTQTGHPVTRQPSTINHCHFALECIFYCVFCIITGQKCNVYTQFVSCKVASFSTRHLLEGERTQRFVVFFYESQKCLFRQITCHLVIQRHLFTFIDQWT